MWDFVKLAPDKLLAISKTLTGASFGFGLSKVGAGFALPVLTIPVKQRASPLATPTLNLKMLERQHEACFILTLFLTTGRWWWSSLGGLCAGTVDPGTFLANAAEVGR